MKQLFLISVIVPGILICGLVFWSFMGGRILIVSDPDAVEENQPLRVRDRSLKPEKIQGDEYKSPEEKLMQMLQVALKDWSKNRDLSQWAQEEEEKRKFLDEMLHSWTKEEVTRVGLFLTKETEPRFYVEVVEAVYRAWGYRAPQEAMARFFEVHKFSQWTSPEEDPFEEPSSDLIEKEKDDPRFYDAESFYFSIFEGWSKKDAEEAWAELQRQRVAIKGGDEFDSYAFYAVSPIFDHLFSKNADFAITQMIEERKHEWQERMALSFYHEFEGEVNWSMLASTIVSREKLKDEALSDRGRTVRFILSRWMEADVNGFEQWLEVDSLNAAVGYFRKENDENDSQVLERISEYNLSRFFPLGEAAGIWHGREPEKAIAWLKKQAAESDLGTIGQFADRVVVSAPIGDAEESGKMGVELVSLIEAIPDPASRWRVFSASVMWRWWIGGGFLFIDREGNDLPALSMIDDLSFPPDALERFEQKVEFFRRGRIKELEEKNGE